MVPDLAPGLYIVSTPIGNLRDMTLRALDVLASADSVYAEDTRRASILFSAYGLGVRARPYHEHNAARVRPEMIEALRSGARIALVSDAGTPLVSDPGFKLVREASLAGIDVFPVPGASAALAALAKAGLPCDRFLFAGFPPPRAAARRRFLEEFATAPATLLFFEGPSRLSETLADMAVIFPHREACVCRELTKKFEEARRGPIEDLARAYAAGPPPLGELVILVGPPGPGDRVSAIEEARRLLADADSDRPLKAVSAEIAGQLDLTRREVYELALKIRQEKKGAEEEGAHKPPPCPENA
jgi:16S rRNA (cytidine1402-2'-O)-methyltransferase